MGINNFLYLLFICAVVFISIEKKQIVVKLAQDEKPMVSFYDSIMYDITTTNITQMIQSTQAYMYKDREELIDGLIITKSKDNNESKINMVKGDFLVKIKDDLYLDGNVHLQLDNSIDLKTEHLEYNTQTQIAKNNAKFKMTQEDRVFNGKDLFLDAQNNHIIASNANIRIKVSDDKK